MDLSINIAVGSAAQVATQPLALVFNGFELGAILFSVLIASHITSQGESTWFEGLMLLAVYAVLVVAFLFA